MFKDEMEGTFCSVISTLLISSCLILGLILSIFLLSKTVREIFCVWMVESFFKKLTGEHFVGRKTKLLGAVAETKSSDVERRKKGELVVLELGVGGGHNFKYYPAGTKLICVDPNRHFKKYFDENRNKFPTVEIKRFICGYGEDIDDIEDGSVDVVVATHVLCSVRDVDRVIYQVKRVLRKGGKFYYADHVGAPGGPLLWIQILLEPLWKLISDNCHFTRNIERAISEAGFAEVQQETEALEKFPAILKYHTLGVATK